MKPEQREDQRYKNEEFCTISKEEEMMFTLLEQHTSSSTPLRVLDLGCGSGRISERIVALGHSVLGLDFSLEAIKKTQARGIEARQANFDEGLPLEDASFDVVWAGDIVEHVFDPIGLLTEANRILKQNGIMLITIPSDVGLISRIKMLFGISHQEQMYYTSGFYKHHTFFTPRLIKYMLKKANLRMEKFHKILILGKNRYEVSMLPSAFFNEMIIQARKI